MDSGRLNRGKKQFKKPLMGALITGRVIRVGRLIGDMSRNARIGENGRNGN